MLTIDTLSMLTESRGYRPREKQGAQGFAECRAQVRRRSVYHRALPGGLHTEGSMVDLFLSCRREKGVLLNEELQKLEKLVKKGKKVTQEIIYDRLAKVTSKDLFRLPIKKFMRM